MSVTANWRIRVVERSVERAAASAGDRRSVAAIARRALRPTTRMVQAAVELAEEAGSASFTVQDVLKRADVSLQTFYRHFSSKDELLLAVLEETVTSGTEEYRKSASVYPNPIDQLEVIIKAPLLGQWSTHNRLSPMIVREHLRLMEGHAREVRAADEPYRELVRATIVAAQASGRFTGIDASEEAELIMALILARFHSSTLGAVSRSAAEEAEHVWGFCFAALSRTEETATATLKPSSSRARSPRRGAPEPSVR